MVDAEHSHFQPMIDALALRLQQRYNRDAPIILNTYQVCASAGRSWLQGRAPGQPAWRMVFCLLAAFPASCRASTA